MACLALPAQRLGDRLSGLNFERHNEEVGRLWAASRAGHPLRVPLVVSCQLSYLLAHPQINSRGIDFRTYLQQPRELFELQLAALRWMSFNLLQDAPLGVPTLQWPLPMEFPWSLEAAWFGQPLVYHDPEEPRVLPADSPEEILRRGIPDPLAGPMAWIEATYAYARQRVLKETYLERPVEPQLPLVATGTQGPWTLAVQLLGRPQVMALLQRAPERLETFLAFLTESVIRRIYFWRTALRQPLLADHQALYEVELGDLSLAEYRRWVLPQHQRLWPAFASRRHRQMVLGQQPAGELLTAMRDELGIRSFRLTGVSDLPAARQALGTEVRIVGGLESPRFGHLTPEQVAFEIEQIMSHGVLMGGQFVLEAAMDVHTPLANVDAFYQAGWATGQFQRPR